MGPIPQTLMSCVSNYVSAQHMYVMRRSRRSLSCDVSIRLLSVCASSHVTETGEL